MKTFRTIGIVVGAIVILVAVVVGVTVFWASTQKQPLPIEDRCSATAGGRETVVDPEQAYNAAIISGVSIKRGLPPRAASIALATAYQESDIHNLDYGHADSIGLFQQRPSKGWGTEAQIMDPWYSSKSFYKELVKVKKWKTRDINDVAQAVQRSAFPDAYRKHVDKARTLASSLTGETAASFSCVIAKPGSADAAGMRTFLSKNMGAKLTITHTPTGLAVHADNNQDAWAGAQQAVAATKNYGLKAVRLGQARWTHSPITLAPWEGTDKTATTVDLIFTVPKK